MADGKDGKYLTRILGMKGYMHTGGKAEDKMRRVLATNALLGIGGRARCVCRLDEGSGYRGDRAKEDESIGGGLGHCKGL